MKFEFGPFIFNISPVPTLAFLLLLPTFISLGFWQLGRAEEKKLMLETQAGKQSLPQIVFNSETQDDLEQLEYRKVRITGQYDENHQFLIDNQIVEGRAGYFVVTPFIPDGLDKAVLINRGWVPGSYDRSVLPDISIQNKHRTLTGRVKRFPSVGIKMEGAEIPSPGWPSIIQVADSRQITKKLQYKVFGFQVQLDKDQPEGYRRDWKSVSAVIPPEKHLAYAFQWFALALTLVILFIGLNIKKKDDYGSTAKKKS